MLSDFAEKKRNLFDYKKQNISKSQRSHFFSILDLIKITLQIMLSDFAEKKETFFDLKKQHFSKSIKSLFFRRG